MTAIGSSDDDVSAAEAAATAELPGRGSLRYPHALDRLGCVACLSLLCDPVAGSAADAATSEVADAAMRGDREAVRAALARKADVNAAQADGSTALHWAVERDDLDMADAASEGGGARRRADQRRRDAARSSRRPTAARG